MLKELWRLCSVDFVGFFYACKLCDFVPSAGREMPIDEDRTHMHTGHGFEDDNSTLQTY